MFRIISCFELEPDEHSDPLSKLVVHKPTSKEPKASPAKVDPVNPIKFLLYQPSIQALLSYLSNSFKDVADKQCLVVYLSGEGNESAETNVDYAFGAGGISTNRRTGTQTGYSFDQIIFRVLELIANVSVGNIGRKGKFSTKWNSTANLDDYKNLFLFLKKILTTQFYNL